MENEKISRDFKGVWIPREIWLDKDLNALDKIILTEIDSLDGEDGCWASNKYLAEFCQCSVSKVAHCISKLIEKGYIYLVSFDGRKRVLKSCLANFASLECKKSNSGMQKMQIINIENNKDNNNIEERKKEEPEKIDAEQNDVPDKKKKSQTQNYNEIIDDYTENTELKEALFDFIKMRKLNKKIMSNRALNMLLKKLNTYASNDKEKIQILENSILKSWQDIYPLNNEEEKPFKQVKKINNSIPKDEETYKRMKQFEELGIGYDNEF